jgi:hypothetical protein
MSIIASPGVYDCEPLQVATVKTLPLIIMPPLNSILQKRTP